MNASRQGSKTQLDPNCRYQMIKYDEKANIARLSHLHPSSRATFSLCCVTRQTATWEEYARQFRPNDVIAFRKTAETIWNTLASNALPLNWKPTLDEVMGLFPEEQSEASPLHTYAEDALASLAYLWKARGRLATPRQKAIPAMTTSRRATHDLQTPTRRLRGPYGETTKPARVPASLLPTVLALLSQHARSARSAYTDQ